jgi:hypothetical protein
LDPDVWCNGHYVNHPWTRNVPPWNCEQRCCVWDCGPSGWVCSSWVGNGGADTECLTEICH